MAGVLCYDPAKYIKTVEVNIKSTGVRPQRAGGAANPAESGRWKMDHRGRGEQPGRPAQYPGRMPALTAGDVMAFPREDPVSGSMKVAPQTFSVCPFSKGQTFSFHRTILAACGIVRITH